MKTTEHFNSIAEQETALEAKCAAELSDLKSLVLKSVDAITRSYQSTLLGDGRNLLNEIKIYGLSTSLGLLAGILAKKILIGNSNSPLKKLLGVSVQLVFTALLSKKIRKGYDNLKALDI